MSLWNKIITQNKIDSALISDLNDISYKSTKGRREKGRGFKDGIVDLGTLLFKDNPPPDKITKEMIHNRTTIRVTPDRAVARQVSGFGRRSRMTSEGDTNAR